MLTDEEKVELTRIEKEDICLKLRSSGPEVVPLIARAFAPQGVTEGILHEWRKELRDGTVPAIPGAFG